MPLEITDTIEGLVSSNPIGIDSTTEGNDHLQLLKIVLKNIFPGVGGQGWAIPVTSTEEELNFSQGLLSNTQAQITASILAAEALVEAEALLRSNEDLALGIRIDDEAVARLAGDDALSVDIGSEATLRSDADIVLQNNIDAEALTRLNADNALDGRITVLETAPPFAPAGTRMLFSQAAAPTGWVQDAAQDNRMLRVVSGAGGGVGGTDSPIALSQATAHVHSTPAVALSIAQMPSHNHSYEGDQHQITYSTGGGIAGTNENFPKRTINMSFEGGGATHSHGNTGTAGIPISFAMRFQNIIVCTKS